MERFKLEVSKEEINKVEFLMKVVNIRIPVLSRSQILGEIFSRKLRKVRGILYNDSDCYIKFSKTIKVEVSGTRIVETSAGTKEVPIKKELTVQTLPVQFENFELVNNRFLTFTMSVKNEEWEDENVIRRLPQGEIKHIHNKKYVIKYPEEEIKMYSYWNSIFSELESSDNSNESELIRATFNTLKRWSLFPLYGTDVLGLYRINVFCIEKFPKFRELSKEARLAIFNVGIHNAITRNGLEKLIGPHMFSKYILEELIKQKIHSVYGKYELYYTYYRDSSSKKWDNIKYISYLKPNGRHTSFSPFAIWHEMAGSYEESVGEDG